MNSFFISYALISEAKVGRFGQSTVICRKDKMFFSYKKPLSQKGIAK
ncbi:hypothetical protein HMPREF0658_2221 [Hoylesella marshii DSM 16973 = JCM 13450]|uniref:Uncharacterized protein n=1 Tax=Hoylesella marshii DSM 16973 = JCM 13450 TaxID=862515 RepID=E0NVL6_9BACT|nr:hypothetical protein HMPREF0658_2221 [Hoylesella marshii DSM 16973 = JCM 13450]